MADQEIWGGVLTRLRTSHPNICRQWFEDLEPLGISEGLIHVRAGSDVHRDYLKRACSDPFSEAARDVTGRLISVRFLGPGDALDPAELAPPRAPSRLRDDSLPINPDNTFENFVQGPGNRLAHAGAVAVAANPGKAFNPVFIHGGVGLGKTHLLHAICIRISQERPDATLCYISCESFVSQYMQAIQLGEMEQFRSRFREADVLVVDDVQFLSPAERSQEEFFHTFNELYQAKRQIVLSSDDPPEKIPTLQERLVSRFKWGFVAEVQPPCYETRVAIVKSKAALRGVEVPDDVACLVASRRTGSIRELENALTSLQAQVLVDGGPITMSLAREALGEPAEVAAAPSVEIITSTVTDFYNVRIAELQSKKRHRSVALPRQVCMYLMRKLTRHSLEEIGGMYGGRDHTTVMHAVKTIEAKRGADDQFDAVVASLEKRVTGR